MAPTLTELIDRAPWREAVTYRETWPHEYVLSRKDDQRALVEAVCARFRAGEGVSCRFFRMRNTYLFIGDYKYWLMSDCDEIDLDADVDYVLNRARLYRDRRDFLIQPGDTGMPEDYPVSPPRPLAVENMPSPMRTILGGQASDSLTLEADANSPTRESARWKFCRPVLGLHRVFLAYWARWQKSKTLKGVRIVLTKASCSALVTGISDPCSAY